MGIGVHCLLVHCQAPAAAVALVADHQNARAVNVTNIVPRETGRLSVEQYNQIAERFVSDLRQFSRQKGCDLKVKLSRFELSLQTAIPSARCREFFEDYLRGYPLTFHPSDMERLDCFVCALHRYRGSVDLEALFAHLVTQRQWSSQDAGVIRDRIRIGLDVLKANQRF